MTLPSWNPQNLDLALMTFEEFRDVVDAKRQSLPSSAYQTTVDSLSEYIRPARFGKLVRQLTIRGLKFTIRMDEQKLQYSKYDPNDQDELLRDEKGLAVMQSDEEIAAAGLKPYDWSVAIFDEDGHAVAALLDEWGCVLVMVAKEYRGFGFGHILFRMWPVLFPDKPSGGFTQSGFNAARKMHREIIREALAAGRYSKMVRSGQITIDRVQEILQSVDLSKRLSKPSEVPLTSTNPKDWLIYVGGYGDYIIYDRKFRTLLDEEESDLWVDKMLLGMVYVAIDGSNLGRIKVFDGESDKIKALLMSFAIQDTIGHGGKLVVEPEDIRYLPKGTPVDEVSKAAGYDSIIVDQMVMQHFDLKPFIALEKAFRADDRYGEFLNTLLERAHSKFH